MSPWSNAIFEWHPRRIGPLALLPLLALAAAESSSCSWSGLVEVTTSLGAFVADGLILKNDGHAPRGLWTTVPLKAGDEIMKIPRKLMLGEAQGAKMAKMAGDILDEAPSASASTLFSLASAVLFLEQQLNEGDSPGARLAKAWHPCLQEASKEWSAAYFSTAQHAASSVSVHSQDIAAAAWAVEELKNQGVDKARAQLAVHLALSRGNNAKSSSGKAMSVMAPMMDFINHDTSPNTRADTSQPYFSVTADRDISAGEMLTSRYIMGGSRISWISRYGFVPVYNVPDAVLRAGEPWDLEVREALDTLQCPEWLINGSLVLLSAKDLLGLGELQLDCLELIGHLKLGMPTSDALDTIRNPSRVRRVDESMAAVCSSFAKKFHTAKALKALGKLRKIAAESPLKKLQQDLAQALLAEVDAIGNCAWSGENTASTRQPQEEQEEQEEL